MPIKPPPPTPPPARIMRESFLGGFRETRESKRATKEWRQAKNGAIMSDEPRGKDGVARVLARVKKEFKIWRRAIMPHWKRLKKNPLDSHAFVNIWTEGCRVREAAYFNGHLIVWLICTNVITAGVLVLSW